MASSTGVLGLNLASRLLLLVIKLWAFAQTGFLVLLGEALNSLVDLIVTVSLLLGERLGRKAGDAEHPFGHRRARHVISLMVAVTFITVTGLQLVREAVPRLLSPVAPSDAPLAYIVLGVSFLVNLVPLAAFVRSRMRGEILLKTAFYDTLNDQVAILAALLGVWWTAQGHPWADPVASLVVAALIAGNAVVLIRENGHMLLGRSPDPAFYKRVEQAVLEIPDVRGVHDMIAEYIGVDAIHMDMDIEVDPQMTVRQADRIEQQVRQRLRELGVVSCEVHPCGHHGEPRKIHDEL